MFWTGYVFSNIPYHWLSLPDTFQEYLARHSSKTRYSEKRNIKALMSLGNGSLELIRVERPEQVSQFVMDATAIAANSWQRVFLNARLDFAGDCAASLREFSAHGWLRAYLLKCGERPCAYLIGFQFGPTYTVYETAFHPDFARHSPGGVLHHLVIEDLIAYRKPAVYYLGAGDAPYKTFLCDGVGREADVVLFRPNRVNRIWFGSHAFFRGAIRRAKRILGKEQLDAGPRGLYPAG
jgi:hypothetical protein